MRKALSAGLLLFALLGSIHAADPARLAVLDFDVQSDNPAFKYLGKGFAEFISVELMKSKQIQLIEREKRNDLLQELEFRLSDISGSGAQVQVGRILDAAYLVTGNIFDFAGKLSVTYQLVAAETGQILVKDTIEGAAGRYGALTAGIARTIVRQLPAASVPVSRTPEKPGLKPTAAKAEPKPRPAKAAPIEESRGEEVLVAFSRAIDSYDKKNVEEAKQRLKEARRLDPGNDAVTIYLDKLLLNTSKFKTIPELYYPTHNPAYLGILQYDRLSYVMAVNIMTAGDWQVIEQYPDLRMHENDMRMSVSYQMPLSRRMGLEAGYITYSTRDEIWDPVLQPTDTSGRAGNGAVLAWGWSPTDTFAFGLAATLYAQVREGFAEAEGGGGTEEYHDPTYFRQALSAGFLVKTRDSAVVFDSYVGLSTEGILYFDPATFPNKRSEMDERNAPLFNENTLTLALNQRRTFLIIKQLNDLQVQTGSYYGRLMPAVEHWVLPWMSVRAGVEAAIMKLGEDLRLGFGGTGGLSFRIGTKGWEADLSVTFRRRPSRFIDGEFLEEIIPYMTVTKNRTYVYR